MRKAIIEIKAKHQIRQMLLTGEPVSIGHDEANSLAFNDDRVSSFHCVIEKKGRSFHIRDLGSADGTRVNGELVAAKALESGDVITVGPVKLRFRWAVLRTRKRESDRKKQLEPESDKVVNALEPRETREVSDTSETPETEETSDTVLEAPGIGEVPEDQEAAMPLRNAPQLRSEPSAQKSGPLSPAKSPSELPVVTEVEGDLERIVAAAVEHEKVLRDMMVMAHLSVVEDKGLAMALVNTRGQVIHAHTDEDVEAAVRSGRDSVLFLRTLLLLCMYIRATDLHIEPNGSGFPIRIRVDGMMVSVCHMHPVIAARLMRLVKVLCEMNIAQTGTIQDGHFCATVPDRRIDYRVSFTPAMHGQKLVIRVLDQAHAPTNLKDLGLSPWMAQDVSRVLGRDSGMVLLCGPTGSGKTTSLYALIREVDVSLRNVITIEDPVEYQIDGVTQMPTNEARGNSFSNLLRSVLRQDPDVILVGEIRDSETAKIAMQASITGHLVLSTVHAQDSIGTVYRLLDLGVERYLVAQGLNLILAQRLVRRLCVDCRKASRPSSGQMMRFAQYGLGNVATVYSPIGCRRCLKTGYIGRCALFELLSATDDLRDAILATQQVHEMRKAVQKTLFTSLAEMGYRLVVEGVTNIEEIDRVVGA